MWSIKVFGKCVLSYYTHSILRFPANISHIDFVISSVAIDCDNIKMIRDSYFDVSNMSRILFTKRNKAQGFIIKNDVGDIVGYFCVANKGGKEFHYHVRHCDAFIFDFTVLEKYRRKGYGKAIVQTIIAQFKNEEILLAVKTDNRKALLFYKALGFEYVKTVKFIRLFRIDIPILYV